MEVQKKTAEVHQKNSGRCAIHAHLFDVGVCLKSVRSEAEVELFLVFFIFWMNGRRSNDDAVCLRRWRIAMAAGRMLECCASEAEAKSKWSRSNDDAAGRMLKGVCVCVCQRPKRPHTSC